MNLRRVFVLAQKEWRETLRDRIFFAMSFLLSPMMMVVFGYGMSQDVENVPLAVLDYDHSASSRDYAHRFTDSHYFRFVGYVGGEREADELLAAGAARVVLVLPDGFHRRLISGRPAEAQTLIDGTFTLPVTSIQGYVEAINAAASAQVQLDYAARRLGFPPERAAERMQPLRIEMRYLYNPEMRSLWTVSPLLIMFILMWTGPMLIALSVVREKESGSIYNVYASTLTRAEYMAGKLLPNVGISFLNALVMWGLACWVFGAPFRGNALFFMLVTLIYVVAVSGYGLVVSLFVKTQQAALMISIILGAIIATEYSGMNTPVEDMTGATYYIAHAFPAMYYNRVVEAVFLRGAGPGELWREPVSLTLNALGMLLIGHTLFKKRVKA